MKKSIKLRDLTAEQWDKNRNLLCKLIAHGDCDNCNDCIFQYVRDCSDSIYRNSWINHKDLFSDKFLDQEVEVEISDIITKKEKEYLSDIIKLFRDKISFIEKCFDETTNDYFISIYVNTDEVEGIRVSFSSNNMYEGMKLNKEYSLEDLGL